MDILSDSVHAHVHPLCRVVGLWKEKLAVTNQKAAQSLADPGEYENLFPGLQEAILAEEALRGERAQLQPASSYPHTTVRGSIYVMYTVDPLIDQLLAPNQL